MYCVDEVGELSPATAGQTVATTGSGQGQDQLMSNGQLGVVWLLRCKRYLSPPTIGQRQTGAVGGDPARRFEGSASAKRVTPAPHGNALYVVSVIMNGAPNATNATLPRAKARAPTVPGVDTKVREPMLLQCYNKCNRNCVDFNKKCVNCNSVTNNITHSITYNITYSITNNNTHNLDLLNSGAGAHSRHTRVEVRHGVANGDGGKHAYTAGDHLGLMSRGVGGSRSRGGASQSRGGGSRRDDSRPRDDGSRSRGTGTSPETRPDPSDTGDAAGKEYTYADFVSFHGAGVAERRWQSAGRALRHTPTSRGGRSRG
eukprot:gene2767-213_t